MIKKEANMNPAELLRPFAEVGNLSNISLNTCEKNSPFKLTDFKVNFIESTKMDGPSVSD